MTKLFLWSSLPTSETSILFSKSAHEPRQRSPIVSSDAFVSFFAPTRPAEVFICGFSPKSLFLVPRFIFLIAHRGRNCWDPLRGDMRRAPEGQVAGRDLARDERKIFFYRRSSNKMNFAKICTQIRNRRSISHWFIFFFVPDRWRYKKLLCVLDEKLRKKIAVTIQHNLNSKSKPPWYFASTHFFYASSMQIREFKNWTISESPEYILERILRNIASDGLDGTRVSKWRRMIRWFARRMTNHFFNGSLKLRFWS